jgi:hypothetical protein
MPQLLHLVPNRLRDADTRQAESRVRRSLTPGGSVGTQQGHESPSSAATTPQPLAMMIAVRLR